MAIKEQAQEEQERGTTNTNHAQRVARSFVVRHQMITSTRTAPLSRLEDIARPEAERVRISPEDNGQGGSG
jgi:hypothetical protein